MNGPLHPVFGTPSLSDEEQKRLVDLGVLIMDSLDCDVNETGLPCRTDRTQAVGHMVEYLRVHGYDINDPVDPPRTIEQDRALHEARERWDRLRGQAIEKMLGRRD